MSKKITKARLADFNLFAYRITKILEISAVKNSFHLLSFKGRHSFKMFNSRVSLLQLP